MQPGREGEGVVEEGAQPAVRSNATIMGSRKRVIGKGKSRADV